MPSLMSAGLARARGPAPNPPLVPPPASYRDVPVLVISGELDNMTSRRMAGGGRHYPHAHHVVIANSFTSMRCRVRAVTAVRS